MLLGCHPQQQLLWHSKISELTFLLEKKTQLYSQLNSLCSELIDSSLHDLLNCECMISAILGFIEVENTLIQRHIYHN